MSHCHCCPGLLPCPALQGGVDHEGGGWLAGEEGLPAASPASESPLSPRLTLGQLSASPYETHSIKPPQQVGQAGMGQRKGQGGGPSTYPAINAMAG